MVWMPSSRRAPANQPSDRGVDGQAQWEDLLTMDESTHAGPAGPAALLLGLSGIHSESQPQAQQVMVEPPLASSLMPRETNLAAPQCTPAVVAAALMSASSTSEADSAASTTAAAAADPTKNRRLQVSALPRKEWSAKEDALIRSGVEQMGCRWRVIAAQLPGRSDDAVRNRWSRLQESLRGGPAQSRRTSGGSSSHDGEGTDAVGDGASGSTSAGRPSAGDAESANAASGLQSSPRAMAGGCTSSPTEPGAHGTFSGDRVDAGEGKAIVGAGAGGTGCAGRPGSSHKAKAGGTKAGSRKCDAVGSSSSSSSGAGSASGGPPEKKERTSWTRAEDDVIIQGVADLGHKWYEIARRLPGRTDHAIRNRWSRLQSIIGMQSMSTESSARPSPQMSALAIGSEATSESLLIRPMQVQLPPPAQQLANHTSATTILTSPVTSAPAMLPSVSNPRVLAPTNESTIGHSPLSTAALASVERLGAEGASGVQKTCGKIGDGASGGSEASDAELTTGTAELLLLQSGGAPSCQPSPQISAAPRPAEDCPDIHAGLSGDSTGIDVLLLNKRPRV